MEKLPKAGDVLAYRVDRLIFALNFDSLHNQRRGAHELAETPSSLKGYKLKIVRL